MQRSILAPALAAALLAAPVAHAADVGVSIEISQPGVYGRIDIGRFPQPAVVLPQPVIIVPPPPHLVVRPEPVYVWVPYGHRKDWKKQCHRYNACGVPVYFVRHDWYDQNVRHADDPGHKGKGTGKSEGKGKGH
jgi:hypothetical protein